jgi:hypothetical protein
MEGQRICSRVMTSASFREVTKTSPRKYCSLQAEAATAGLKIKSKITNQLRINSEVTTNIYITNVAIERVRTFYMSA